MKPAKLEPFPVLERLVDFHRNHYQECEFAVAPPSVPDPGPVRTSEWILPRGVNVGL